MINIRQCYMATDGQIFLTREKAEKHEAAIFKEWLGSNPKVSLTAILLTADNLEATEFYGTEKDMVMSIAKRAFQLEIQDVVDSSETE